jgi:hypothetical protein
MASIVTSKFRIHNAQQFYESFSEAANTIMYLFVGKNTEFANDNSPPTPINSTANIEYTPWRDMYGVKRIQSADVTHAVPRYDWTSGIVYVAYDDTSTSLLTDTFYVMTEDYNVYKCLFNNASAASTTKPTGTSSARFTTADGYIWKFMYTVSTAKALKFLTSDYMPIQTLASDDGVFRVPQLMVRLKSSRLLQVVLDMLLPPQLQLLVTELALLQMQQLPLT